MLDPLSFTVAYSLMNNITKYTTADFDALGVTEEEFMLTAGDTPWRREHLPRVMRVINCVVYGTMEMMSMPKTNVPAEYQAAIVTTLVAAGNRRIACAWLAQEKQVGVGAQQAALGENGQGALDHATDQQLFALCCVLDAKERAAQARTNMLKHLSINIAKATEELIQ